MQNRDADRYGGSSSNAYSPNLTRPGSRAGGSRRTALKIALCLVLPPVGLVYIWGTGSFRLRGRVLTSVMSFAVMFALCLPLFRQAQLPTVLPQPATPVAATYAPEEDTATALSNIEELLLQQEAAEAEALGEDESAPAPDTTAAPTEEELEAIYNTIVYVANGNPRYYHAAPVCGTQSNPNAITLAQALAMGLGAHPDCDPIVPP